MREIKFRAWDGKKLFKPFDMAWYIEGNEGDGSWEDNPLDSKWLVGTIFEQFTGLLDKNGKEIYEGDIIRMWWGVDKHGPKYRNHPITFTSGQVGPCKGENVMEWSLTNCSNLWNGKDVEIIGNIHENPELLEK